MNRSKRRKRWYVIPLLVLVNVFLISCQQKQSTEGISVQSEEEGDAVEENMETNMNNLSAEIEQEETPDMNVEQADNTEEEEKLESKEETIEPTDETIEPTEEIIEPTASISDEIPSKYFKKRSDHSGSIEHISYTTYDYFGEGQEITKSAYVYLPYEYDDSKQYNVLYLMHGIGGNEKEWGMFNDTSRVKVMMDNLIYYGDIEPFIVVTPNGRSSAEFANTNSDYHSFYLFGQELRNDLIPYIERTYSTFATYDEAGYDLSATRDHRAMAGLSMGGMQTINIGMCECLDIMSYFGAFSAAPTTNSASTIVKALEEFPEDEIHYFYNICGTKDSIAWASSTAATKTLTSLTDRFVEDKNYMWQEVDGNHDFNVWYLGFYNFAQLVFE